MLIVFLAMLLAGPAAQAQSPAPDLRQQLADRIGRERGEVSLVYLDPERGETISVAPDRRYHAASTMKVPVLIALAREVDRGARGWRDSETVRNRFESIVDRSPYVLDRADDSDSTLYAEEGRPETVERLARLMITRSSNLATNLLIARLDPPAITAMARGFGADSIEVLRGVEDNKAYQRGLNNTTTALDLARLLTALAEGRVASSGSTRVMLDLLLAQEFNDRIPAGLPPGVRVAHKTGEITGIAHDAAIVYPAGRGPYVLVILTRGYDDPKEAAHLMAELSGMVYRDAMKKRTGEGC
jgi:beta-lactamase class A